MKKNILFDVIKYWEELSEKEKLNLLQKFEHVNSKFETREEREIVLKASLERDVTASYRFDAPSAIFVNPMYLNLKTTAINMLDSAFHEGFHAMCDDYFNDKSNIIALSKIDKAKFHEERSLIDILYNRCSIEGCLTLFSLKYYEEETVRKETCLYLLYNLLSSCENINDCFSVVSTYNKAMANFVNYQKITKHVQKFAGHNYEELKNVVLNLDKHMFADKIRPIETSKTISSGIDPLLLQHFTKNLELLYKMQSNEMDDKALQHLQRKYVENIVNYGLSK